jgi:PAS domain S-box-containing protein
VFAVIGALIGAEIERSRSREKSALYLSRQCEQKYRAMLASSFESIVTLGHQAEILECSDSAAALLFGSAATLGGRSIDDFVDIDSENPGGAVRTLSRALRDGNYDSRQEAIDVTALALDGRRFPAEIRITPIPLGGLSKYIVAIRETTDSVVA